MLRLEGVLSGMLSRSGLAASVDLVAIFVPDFQPFPFHHHHVFAQCGSDAEPRKPSPVYVVLQVELPPV